MSAKKSRSASWLSFIPRPTRRFSASSAEPVAIVSEQKREENQAGDSAGPSAPVGNDTQGPSGPNTTFDTSTEAPSIPVDIDEQQDPKSDPSAAPDLRPGSAASSYGIALQEIVPDEPSLPPGLSIEAFKEMSTEEFWYFYNRSEYIAAVIQKHQTVIVNAMSARHYARLRRRWHYGGKPFIEAFQNWTQEKGVYVDIQSTVDSTVVFVKHYVRCNDKSKDADIGDLYRLASGLVSLHLLLHTPKEHGGCAFGYGESGYEDILAEAIPGYQIFPSYAQIDSVDNYLTAVRSNSEFLGPVRELFEGPRTSKRLTTLRMPFVGHLLSEEGHTMEKDIREFLCLRKLPDGFAYCVESEQHLLSIEDVVRAKSSVLVVPGLEKVALLEKIDVV
ncbi:uncharacterized protein LTR77_009753 [Saxophila tyrrhenica]|uniref:Uncharacterized protein n=1 Tax=Saxophila tyrrhenica TaxID=1690608 RepID=A0AAV9NX88_9PEZI|nr:hypothetical protein LTR77_009753 [Saxophila tyrrhenica]